jgi:Protein of unknown function (DUF998)
MKTAVHQNTLTTPAIPAGTRSQTAARLSIAGASLFLVLLALLHFLKPEFDPSWRMISEYEIGRFGWLMTLAFLSVALSSVSLFVAIRSQVHTRAGKIGLVILLISALGMTMGGIFTSDPMTATKDQLTMHGNLHGVGGLLGIPTFPIAAMLITFSLLRNRAWASAPKALVWTAHFTWLSLGLFIGTTAILLSLRGGFGPDVPIGWPNRLLMVAYCAWLITVAWSTLKRREQKV